MLIVSAVQGSTAFTQMSDESLILTRFIKGLKRTERKEGKERKVVEVASASFASQSAA